MSYDLFGMDSSEGQLRKYQELKEERQAIKKSGQDLNSFQQELPIYIKDQKEKDQREYEERLVELNEKLIWLTMNPMSDPHEEWRATCTNFFLEEKQRREELKNMTNEELRAKMKQQDEEFDKLEKKQKEEKVQALPN
jgi:hypothetical protein